MDTDEHSSPKSSLYAGVAALLLALIALGGVFLLHRQVSATPAEDPALVRLEETLARLGERLSALEADVQKASNDLQVMRRDTQRAFDGVTSELGTLRTSTNRMAGDQRSQGETVQNLRTTVQRLAADLVNLATELERRPVATVPRPAPEPVRSPAAGEGTPSPAPDGFQVHTIASGDTFARLAGMYGVSIDRIIEANPGVDPRRLRIGQEILIPRP